MEKRLTPEEKAYLNQIAARIAERVQRSGEAVTESNMLEFAKKAHEETKSFAEEMCCQRTDRAKRAAKMLAAAVWGNVQMRGIQEKVIGQAVGDA
jgi:hypothetical protein